MLPILERLVGRLRGWTPLLLLAALSACGGGGGTSAPPPPPVPAVSLSFNGASLPVRQGQSASLPVSIQRSGGFTGPVRISADGLPAGLSLTVAPAGDIPGDSATATFTAAPSASIGTVQVLLRVVASSGSPSSGAPLALQVQPPPVGFQVSLGTSALTLPRPLPGDTQPRVSQPIPVTLTRVGGYAGSPSWTVEGLPAGVTAAFSPSSAGEPTGFTLSVGPAAAAGASAVMVRATDGSLSATAALTLTLSTGNDYVLKANVRELKAADATVLAVTPTTVTLQGAASSVAAGQVLIHNAPDATRFLRAVSSVDRSSGNTVLSTAAATLEDVFETASISQRGDIPAAALAGMRPANGAVTIGAPIPGLKSPQGDQQLVLPVGITKWQLKDGAGKPLVEVNGSLTLTLGVETRLEKSGFSVSEFRVAPFVNVTGDLDFTGNYTASFSNEYPLTLPFSFPTPLGIGPLGVNGDITLVLEVDGRVDAQGKLHVHGTVNGKAGVQYVNGSWSGVNDFNTGLQLTTAEVRANMQFGVSLLRPKLGLDVLGIGEVHVGSDVVRGEVDITYQTSPTPGFLVSKYGDFQFQVGGSLKLGPLSLWNSQISADLGRFLSGTPQLLPDLRPVDTLIAYVTPDLRQLRVMNGDGSNDRLVYASTLAVFAPCLDPSGHAIAFGLINPSANGDLCTIQTDGSGFANLTNNTYSINHPAWGPGGTIAFDAYDGNHVKQLYLVGAASGPATQLTRDTTNSRHPSWSPDGQSLLYEFQSFSGSYFIARMMPSVPGSFENVYADDTKNFVDPAYSANGRQILFRDDSYFYVATPSGLLQYSILMGPVLLKHPVFSPDGASLAFDANPPGPPSVMVSGADGSGARTVATGSYPSWRQIR